MSKSEIKKLVDELVAIVKDADFEAKHPRDDKGRFGDGDDGGEDDNPRPEYRGGIGVPELLRQQQEQESAAGKAAEKAAKDAYALERKLRGEGFDYMRRQGGKPPTRTTAAKLASSFEQAAKLNVKIFPEAARDLRRAAKKYRDWYFG